MITEPKPPTPEITNKFRITNQQMRRVRRKTDQQVKIKETEKESQFIYLITQLIAEIIKSDVENGRSVLKFPL